MELKISKFLRFGVILSGVLMLVGWLLEFDISADPFLPLRDYASRPLTYTAATWGLVVLIALPVIRVFLTAILFLKQKEHVLALIAGGVLMALFFSFSLGLEI